MRSRLALLVAVFLVTAAPSPSEVVERILAVVNDRPILLGEVHAFEALTRVDRKTALEKVIDEQLMFLEATRLPQAAATADEEERAYRGLRSKVGNNGSLSEFDLRRVARRQVTILKYVEFRFRPQVRVSDEDLRQAYEARYAGRVEQHPFASVARELQQELTEKALSEKIEAWVADLRATAEVRYND